MQFLYKFQSLLNRENNMILCARNFFLNNVIADESEQRINSNSSSSVVVDEKQLFLNWIEQKQIWLGLKADSSSEGVARCLANVPMIAQFNGSLCIEFKNEQNLCGLEEDAKLIYGWISSGGTRQLEIHHYDAQKARELACQIALLFEQAHVNKKETEKMDLTILIYKDTVVPMHMQKVCNGIGDHLATLRTFTTKNKNEIYAVYILYTKPLEYFYENKEELEFFNQNVIYFD